MSTHPAWESSHSSIGACVTVAFQTILNTFIVKKKKSTVKTQEIGLL